MRHAVFALALCSLLSACETMSEDQCRRADWYDRGRRDGASGNDESWIDAHRKACAKANVAPDVARWRQGWFDGIRGYCVPRSAWELGLRNGYYSGVCRPFDDSEFVRWYEGGKEVWKLRDKRDRNSREISKLEDQLKKATKDDERKSLRERIQHIDRDQSQLRRTIESMERLAPR